MNLMLNALALLVCTLTLTSISYAQKKPTTSATHISPKNKTVKSTQTEAPPELEKSEDTKIDVASPEPEFDSTLAPNDELTAEIKKMLATSNAVATGISTAENMLTLQAQANKDPKMEAFYERFLQTFKSARGRALLENIFVKIYRESYTLEEVKELSAFYSTPVGKKTLQVTPVILQKSQSRCAQLGQLLGMEVYQQMTAEKSKN